MKIIIDSGSTKSDWRLVQSDGSFRQLTAKGINPATMSESAIRQIISEIRNQTSATDKTGAEVYLYTAGATSQVHIDICTKILREVFPTAVRIEVTNDLIGAARAACGHNPGIAAIVGTGSNSCFWDGEKIERRIYSGGLILGDEGGGATLGRLFMADFIKGLVPQEIADEFSARYPSDYSSIICNVYNSGTSPSGYLGSLAPFNIEHYSNPYIKELVDNNFRSFIRRSLKQHDTDRYPVGVVGGFGYALKDVFSRIAAEEGITVSRFIKAPIDGLVEYHKC